MLVVDLGDFANVGDAHEAGAADTNGEDLVAGLGHMNQHAGAEDLMIEPFALVGGNDRRVKLVVFSRTDVGDAVFHRFVWVVTS